MSKRILIIDDDTDVLEIMEAALDYEGFKVVTSPVADNYQDLIRRNQIDLIIIDYLLNGINGGEICHQIKTCPEFGHLPVIIYSASPRVLQSLGYYGCDSFIPKPFDLADIVGQVTGLLQCTCNKMFTN
jgi:DNA-binding response OmpR family regulator